MTKTAEKTDTATIPPLLFSPFMVGDAYLRSVKQASPGEATIVEQLNHDFMMLMQKHVELTAIWMNIWAHTLRLPMPTSSKTE